MADIRKWDGSIHPTIKGPLAVYIRDLLATGLYGLNTGEVIRTLIREGVQRAIVAKLIQVKSFENGKPH